MQSVEIAKAVSQNAKLVILDEPTSSLTDNEVEALFRIIRDLKSRGVSMIYISHKMAKSVRSQTILPSCVTERMWDPGR